jgi:hypothetical protein
MNFNIRVHPEIKTQQCIQLQAKLVIAQGGCDTQQTGIFKKILVEFLYI